MSKCPILKMPLDLLSKSLFILYYTHERRFCKLCSISKRNHMVSVCFVLFVKGEGIVQCHLKNCGPDNLPTVLICNPYRRTAIEVCVYFSV